MKLLPLFFCYLWLSTLSPSAYSQENFGLAMHGEPKYNSESQALDYVNPNAPKGGEIVLSALGSYDSLNPYALKGKAAEGLNLFYDRLMGRVWDEPFSLYPLIAEEVVVAENRSEMTIYINKNARFHDDSPILAEDVIFSFHTLKDNGRPNMRRVYKLVKEAKIIDNHTVYFSFGKGYDYETVMILAMMPILSKKWWEHKEFDSSILDIPLSNGPYKIAEVEPGRRIVYERVKDYWAENLLVNKGHYNFDKITYDYYRDDLVAFEAFKSGEYDLRREWDAGKWATEYNFKAVQNGEILTQALPHSRPEKVRGLILNTRRQPFDDIRVRKALTYLFDFDWLNKNLFHGSYNRIDSFFPNTELSSKRGVLEEQLRLLEPYKDELPQSVFENDYTVIGFKSTAQKREFMNLANKLLIEAGFTIQDGKRINSSGDQLSFEILLDNPEYEKIALSYVKNLERMGIKARVRMLDTAAFRGRVNIYDFDMLLYYWSNSLSPGTEQLLYWGCDAAEQTGRWNFPGICLQSVDSLSAQIASAKSREELILFSRTLDRILTHGYYMIPLYYIGKDYVAFKSNVRHPEIIPMYGMVLEAWWAETTQ